MVDPDIERSGRTAMTRRKASAPARQLHSLGHIKGCVLDYGCGKGTDVRWLIELGFDAIGWDPMHASETKPDGEYDTILCTYVLNTLPSSWENKILEDIREKLSAHGTAFITVRRDLREVEKITMRGTLQRQVYLDLPVVKKDGNLCIYKVKNN